MFVYVKGRDFCSEAPLPAQTGQAGGCGQRSHCSPSTGHGGQACSVSARGTGWPLSRCINVLVSEPLWLLMKWQSPLMDAYFWPLPPAEAYRPVWGLLFGVPFVQRISHSPEGKRWGRGWNLSGGMLWLPACLVVSDSATPWAAALQAPLSVGFSRQEDWSGLPFPPSGIFLTQGLNPSVLHLPHWQGDSFCSEPPGKPCLEEWLPESYSHNVLLSI